MYEYQARVVEVIDGDTIDVVVDLGFRMRRQIRLRLSGVDTHETYGVDHDSHEYQLGARETRFVSDWLPDAEGEEWPLVVRTEKRGKYGRYLADVERQSDGAVLNDVLVETFGGVAAE